MVSGILSLGNGPEYEVRLKEPFRPPTATLKEIHDAVPKHLLKSDFYKSTSYVCRDIAFTLFLFSLASFIQPWNKSDFSGYITSGLNKAIVRWSLWGAYYLFQSLVWAGIFVLGHDAGHGTLFENKKLNNVVGLVLHTWLLIPYFAWRATHHAHHKATGSMERDENYIPATRKDCKLPEEKMVTKFDYAEIFEETPIYTLFRIIRMQLFGWWVYLSTNAMGSKMYPPGTNHFMPSSPLFKSKERNSIIITNVSLVVMLTLMTYVGHRLVLQYYLVPYLLTNNWIVLFTYLHHSDPTVPHYRNAEWTFVRGAAATIDRPALGWVGRFFFHNISHDHVAHHFFVKAPFYNGPQITKAIKTVLKDDYIYDSTNVFYALYRSFTECLFVEEEGDIVFYKNKHGVAAREVAQSTLKNIQNSGKENSISSKLD